MKKISIIVPCYNEAENIHNVYKRTTDVFRTLRYEYELIFVDNASTDNSGAVYEELTAQDTHVKVLVMSRNFGTSQPSFLAGLKHATGDAAILIEGDLQDPPELIPQLVKKWREGYDVVYAIRKKRRGTFIRRFFYKCFYIIFKYLSYINIPLDAGDFSLIDRRVIDVITRLPEKDVYIRGLRAWAGFKQTGVTYIRDARTKGKTSIKFFQNFTWAKKAIVNFSYKPLEFISQFTIITACCTMLATALYLYLYFTTNMPRGFPTLLLSIFIFATIQLLSLSIIGEYLIRIFAEIKGRPPYIVAKTMHKTQAPAIITPTQKQTYLVTGGNGFIGSNLVRELVGHDQTVFGQTVFDQTVFVLTEPNPNLSKIQDIINRVEIIECDITKHLDTALRHVRPHHIFHLAAIGTNPNQQDITQLLRVNLHGTINLLNACKNMGFKSFINTGTASEYGSHPSPLQEDFQLKPQDNYSITKAAATTYCRKEAIIHNLPIYTVRPFCTYGDGEPPHRLIPTICRNHFANKPIQLSSPHAVRDFIYVKDVATFYIHLAHTRPKDHIFNIGTGIQHSIQDVVHTIEDILQKPLAITWNASTPRPWEFSNWQADITRAQSLSWHPKHTLKAGIKRYIEHMRTSKPHQQYNYKEKILL